MLLGVIACPLDIKSFYMDVELQRKLAGAL